MLTTEAEGVHEKLVRLLRESVAANPEDTDLAAIADLPDKKLMRFLFSNYRSHPRSAGFRLTANGFRWMRENFSAYSVRFPKDEKVRFQALLHLDREMVMPFYIEAKRIVLFDGAAALRLSLLGGSLNRLYEADRDSVKNCRKNRIKPKSV